MKEVKAYKTTDGMLFTSKRKATVHQKDIDYQASYCEYYVFVEGAQVFSQYIKILTNKGKKQAIEDAVTYAKAHKVQPYHVAWTAIGSLNDIKIGEVKCTTQS